MINQILYFFGKYEQIITFIGIQVGFFTFQYINVYTSQLKNHYSVKGSSREVAAYTTLSATIGGLSTKMLADMPYFTVFIVSVITNMTASYAAKEMIDRKNKQNKSYDTYKIGGIAKNEAVAEVIIEELRDLDLTFSVLVVEKRRGVTKRLEVYAENKQDSRNVVAIFKKHDCNYDVVKLIKQSFV